MPIKNLISTLTLAALLAGGATLATAQEKTDFKVAWSIYVGWMPWGYAADTGIVKKWADKYGITIEVTQFNDYVESINQYTAGAYDAVTLTNMDGLSIPAAGGVDTTDPDMVGAFQTPEVTAMVTWNPMVSEILALPNATKVFDSAQIPGEII